MNIDSFCNFEKRFKPDTLLAYKPNVTLRGLLRYFRAFTYTAKVTDVFFLKPIFVAVELNLLRRDGKS